MSWFGRLAERAASAARTLVRTVTSFPGRVAAAVGSLFRRGAAEEVAPTKVEPAGSDSGAGGSVSVSSDILDADPASFPPQDVRGYFVDRADAEVYASEIPVPAEIYYDPAQGLFFVVIIY